MHPFLTQSAEKDLGIPTNGFQTSSFAGAPSEDPRDRLIPVGLEPLGVPARNPTFFPEPFQIPSTYLLVLQGFSIQELESGQKWSPFSFENRSQ